MVEPVTLPTAAAAAASVPPLAVPRDAPAQAQVDAFWRQIRLKTAVYLAQGHGLGRPQAMETARCVVAAVRTTMDIPDREAALARCLSEAAARMEAIERAAHPRPAALPVAGLPMDPQPLAPVLIAPSPMADRLRLWAMATAAMLVPALSAFAVIMLS